MLWIPGASGTAQLSVPYIAFGDGAGGGVWHTSETHNFETTVELRFPLSVEQVRLIEATAHKLQTPNLGLALMISPAFALVRDVEQVNTAGMPGQMHMLSHAFDLRPLAWPTVDRLELNIGRDEWVEIARSLGLEELRVLAMRLPKQVPGLDSKLVVRFDEAVASTRRATIGVRSRSAATYASWSSSRSGPRERIQSRQLSQPIAGLRRRRHRWSSSLARGSC